MGTRVTRIVKILDELDEDSITSEILDECEDYLTVSLNARDLYEDADGYIYIEKVHKVDSRS